MDAIEIYQNILAVTKDGEFNDVITALSFAQRKIENEHYSSQKNSQLGLASSNLYGAAALNNQYNPEANAIALVRQAVAAELDARDANQEKVPEAA